MQVDINPDFGGSKDQARAHLCSQVLVSRVTPLPAQQRCVEAFEQACTRKLQRSASVPAAVLDSIFLDVPRSAYSAIPQGSPAWFELRRRLPLTASRVWAQAGLSLTLPRKQRGLRHGLHLAKHLTGMLHPLALFMKVRLGAAAGVAGQEPASVAQARKRVALQRGTISC